MEPSACAPKTNVGSTVSSASQDHNQQASNRIPHYIAADPIARDAFLKNQNPGYFETLKSSRMAVFWAVIFAFTIVGEGYDLALMGNFFALPSFQDLFGSLPQGRSKKEIPPMWQSLIQCATLIGQLTAIYISGLTLDRFGFRKTVLVALSLVNFFLLVSFFSPEALKVGGSNGGLGMLLAGEFLLGLPWGVFQAAVLPYASEIAPSQLRPTLTTFVNMCWLIGQLLATAAIKAVTGVHKLQAFRIPIALQWIWPIPIAICVFLAPESPYWLVRHDRPDKALKSIKRLDKDHTHAEGTLRVMELTNKHERESKGSVEEEKTGGTVVNEVALANADTPTTGEAITYMNCFKGTNRRRTEVVAMLNLTQQLCGSCLMYYSAKLYQKGGIDSTKAFDYTLIQYGLGIVAIASSWLLLRRLPRRLIWISGVAVSGLLMVGVGVLGFFARGETPSEDARQAIPWVIVAFLITFTGIYNLSIGPLAYSLASEIPSTRLKSKTVAIGRSTYLVFGLFNLFLTPKMLEDKPNGWGLGPSAALVFGAFNLCIFLPWAFLRLPETKDRSFAEIDLLFKSGVPARQWSTTQVSSLAPPEAERPLSD
ncbi:general substrate transporter [Plectosphaerella plurivora]|uniref:General substrate transporter n=1 Tax=Plectosphaerella plurivora TaxID=936078 RepID=A0A9P8V176_9PEZI|nr:general substrate transporter [Plectosphaerella plurivora]